MVMRQLGGKKITPGDIARRERNFSKTPVGMRAQNERNRLGRLSGETSGRQQREDRARARAGAIRKGGMIGVRRKMASIAEDDRRFDPVTMGNRKYGPGARRPSGQVMKRGTGPGPNGSYPRRSRRPKAY